VDIGEVLVRDVEATFYTVETDRVAAEIALELANRNHFAYIDYPELVTGEPSADGLVSACNALHSEVLRLLSDPDVLSRVILLSDRPAWLSSAVFLSRDDDDVVDIERLARGIGAGLVQRQAPGIDHHVMGLSDSALVKELQLKIMDADNLLVSLHDDRIELRNHGMVVDDHTLVYPHQFLRRFYRANFVGMPGLLNRAKAAGASVSLRVDPFRRTTVDHYREIFELDAWYGQPFSESLLQDKHFAGRTVHRGACLTCLRGAGCEIFTVFRTDMMDENERQFKIEEYCYLEDAHGLGEQYCIEKFGHVVYDQNVGCFTHLDGAVRVFPTEEYIDHLDAIERGRDVDEKIGQRHKLFLVEGALASQLVQELLSEWFRYNPHISEYFSSGLERLES
jgi:hypothetical protein